MVISMTGFGRAKVITNTYQIVVEMKSVNHRFFETSIRMPRKMMEHEGAIKKLMQEKMRRGRVEVSILIEGENLQETKLIVHRDLVEQYMRTAKQLKAEYDLQDELALKDILLLPNVVEQIEVEKENPEILEKLLEVSSQAVTKLQAMRKQEGERLCEDIISKLKQMEQAVSAVEEQAPKVIERYKERLNNKLEEVDELDLQRFVTEVAVMTDRCDINEEIIRLNSHIKQFYATLKSNESIGRKMEFLLQEMNREVNTIGSKGNDIQISSHVVEMKNNLEKIREQVQNIE